MIDVIIIGAGGSGLGIHGRLLTVPARSTKYRVVGFVDVDADKAAAAAQDAVDEPAIGWTP